MKLFEKWPLLTALIISTMLIFCIEHLFKTATVPDFSKISQIQERKQVFFSYLYQQIIPINKKVAAERKKLLKLKDNSSLQYSEKRFIRLLAKKYKINTQNLTAFEIIQRLLIKVDQIPPALIMAQAANESAWGTSRFARQANNYFGIWCYTRGCGLVPKARGTSERHEVRRFASVSKSVAYYVHLINSHRTYKELRAIRSDLKSRNIKVSAVALAPGLRKYSTRGKKYVADLISLIQYNKLNDIYPLNDVD